MTEFTGVDMEISWIDSHEDVMKVEEEWLQYIYSRVKEIHGNRSRSTLVLIRGSNSSFSANTYARSRRDLEITRLYSAG
jgi:aspartyl/asparaginyl-tRNA synthetase